MFCQKCGKEIPDGSVACNFCGAPLVVIAVEPEKSKEITLTQVAEGAIVFAILGLFVGGIAGVIFGFIIGFIICYAGASMYEAVRKK
jgi:uncharacterized membrane protein YvbJ